MATTRYTLGAPDAAANTVWYDCDKTTTEEWT